MVRGNEKTKVLHITPHLGGGVGNVLLHYTAFDKSNRHSIAALDYSNDKSIRYAAQYDFDLYSNMYANKQELSNLVKDADIVLVHFWNHPLLYDLLANNELPAGRLVFWAHILGFSPPAVFVRKILDYPDRFVFTTPLSFNAEPVQNYDKKKLSVIFSTGGLDWVKNILPLEHTDFTVGYVGTVDYAKMHPNYITVHKQIDIPDIKFIIVGGNNEKEIAKNAGERFLFTGPVDDVAPFLAQMDVFGYLLNEKHYGTGEHVLQEAMAAGLVPVVLNNPTESMMVEHGKTGLVAKDLEEYRAHIKLLYEKKDLRIELSNNAKEYAFKTFSLERLTFQWNMVYNELMELPKTVRTLPFNHHVTPYELFLESLGDYKYNFLNKNKTELKNMLQLSEWKSETKGTPRHYQSFFKNDADLNALCSLYEAAGNS